MSQFKYEIFVLTSVAYACNDGSSEPAQTRGVV